MKKVIFCLFSACIGLFLCVEPCYAQATNLALNKSATAGTTWSSTYAASKAFDGSATSRWSAASGSVSNQWIQADLGANTTFDRIVVKEFNSRITSYQVQYSDNNTAWNIAYDGTDKMIVSDEEIVFNPVTSRYMRLHILSASKEPSIFEIGVYYQQAEVTLPPIGSGMIFENIKGALSKVEMDYYKAYIAKAALPGNNIGNNLVYGTAGLASESMALVYQATGDTAVLNRLIKFCDNMLYHRNDQPGGDKRTLWTGRIEPCWPNKDAARVDAGYAASENGDILGHIYFCAYLIALSPDILDKPAPVSNRQLNWGVTYRDRALRYVELCDQSMEEYIVPNFIDSNNKQRFPAAQGWKNLDQTPNGSANSISDNSYTRNSGYGFPVNQQMMFNNGFQKAAECYGALNIKATQKILYRNIVQTSIDWLATKLSIVNVGGKEACLWYYHAPDHPTQSIEDYGHAAFTFQEYYKAYESLLFTNLDRQKFERFANTLMYRMYDTATNTVFYKVNGTAGGENPITIPKAGWVLLSAIVPELYNYNCMPAITTATTTDIGLMGHFLFVKSKLFGAKDFVPHPINVANYGQGSEIKAIQPVEIRLYPNPAQNTLYIHSAEPVTKVKIYSQTGALVWSENNPSGQLAVSALPEGIYHACIYTGDTKVMQKIIIKK